MARCVLSWNVVTRSLLPALMVLASLGWGWESACCVPAAVEASAHDCCGRSETNLSPAADCCAAPLSGSAFEPASQPLTRPAAAHGPDLLQPHPARPAPRLSAAPLAKPPAAVLRI